MRSLLAAVPQPRRPVGVTARTAADPTPDLPAAVLALAESEVDAAADALHDGALQALVVARYAADVAVRGGDPTLARDAVQEALVALRRAVWMLRPRGTHGLREALDQLAAHLAATGGGPLHLDVDEAADAALHAPVRTDLATAAYRFVQHAAAAGPLTVRIRRTPTGLRLALDVPAPDGEVLRAQAVGATLLATADSAALHLPLALDPLTPHPTPEVTP